MCRCPWEERWELSAGSGLSCLCILLEIVKILALLEHFIGSVLCLLLVIVCCGSARSIEESVSDVRYHLLVFRDLVFGNILFLILACKSRVLKDRAVSLLVAVRSEIELEDRIKRNSCRDRLLVDPVLYLLFDRFLILGFELDAGSLCTCNEDVCALQILLCLIDVILCICLAVVTICAARSM